LWSDGIIFQQNPQNPQATFPLTQTYSQLTVDNFFESSYFHAYSFFNYNFTPYSFSIKNTWQREASDVEEIS